MTGDDMPMVLKPKVAKCGNHWSVEWNRKGDYWPESICVPTWEDAMKKAAIVVARKLHAEAM